MGSELVNGLSLLNYNIYANDINFSYKINKNKKIILFKENLLSNNHKININNCDIFIHTCSLTKTNKDKNQNLFKVNLNLTKKALNLAKHLNSKNFFFISSTSVYRKFSKYKYNEKSKTSAQDSYSKSKLIGEKISKDFCKKHKIKLTILRIGNIYSGYEKIKWSRLNVSQIQKWLNDNKKNKMLKTNNFDTLRDWTYVKDIPKALNSLIINNQNFKMLNLVSPYCYKDIYLMKKISKNKKLIKSLEKNINNNASYSIYIKRILFKKWTTFQRAFNLIKKYENL